MRLKKLSGLLICLLLLTHYQINVYAASQPDLIYVNNQQMPKNLVTVGTDGLAYVAASEFAKSLGGTFVFKVDMLAGTITAGGHELVFYLEGKTAALNGKYIQTPAAMKIINNRLMVPVVFASDKLGAVSYIEKLRNVLMIFNPGDGRLVYSVLPGDTLWKISQVFSTTIENVRKNNLIMGDMLYLGQKLMISRLPVYSSAIPAYTTSGTTVFTGPGFSQPVKGYLATGASMTIKGKTGDWYKVDTKLGSGYVHRSIAGITQELSLSPRSTFFDKDIPVDTSRDTISYNDYTVVKGDGIWTISQKAGIPDYELAATNNMTATTMLYPGQSIKIPVHNIAQPLSSDSRSGEVLDWFKQAQYLFPQGKTGRVVDPVTGLSFMVKRTMGANHSDTEPLTASDTLTMKQIFGGAWTWARKALVLEADGRRYAVSIAGMPHAGVDGVPLNQNVDNRSGDYGYGPNDDAIAGNGMDGHFDLYFLNCRRHYDNNIDPEHQYNVLSAGGLR